MYIAGALSVVSIHSPDYVVLQLCSGMIMGFAHEYTYLDPEYI